MFLQIGVALLLLRGSLQQESCSENHVRQIRLAGGTGSAGRVEICWKINTGVYEWGSVCFPRNGILASTRKICSLLNHNDAIDAISTDAGIHSNRHTGSKFA